MKMPDIMQFDTRDKKPKLYNILVLSIITVALVTYLTISDPEKNAVLLGVIYVVYFAAVLVMLIRGFLGQLQYNPYSYNTIIYLGFALLVLSVLVTHIVLTVRIILWPDMYHGTEILRTLAFSARNYMFLSFPFIFIFSTALCVSNISLIRHEGRRVVNILGIILSFLMIGGAVLLYVYDFYTTGSEREMMIHDFIVNLYAAVYIYFECMLIGAAVAALIAASYTPNPDKDFLIILGCGIRKDGTPTPLLRGRCDIALDFYRNQKEKTGKELIFVTSGGQGPDEVTSESASMRQYLIEQGIPEDQIIEENQSTSTFENMKFSKEKIWAVNPEGKIAFATTNYHVFRGGLCARRVKMRAVGMGAKTKWYFWPNAAVREFVGLMTAHLGKQAAVFGGLVATYALLTYLIYK